MVRQIARVPLDWWLGFGCLSQNLIRRFGRCRQFPFGNFEIFGEQVALVRVTLPKAIRQLRPSRLPVQAFKQDRELRRRQPKNQDLNPITRFDLITNTATL